jgi:uncharacterized membrane protein YdjX (TVP38/TMEM64 family)/rhodanese-related sulfurtransferase
MSAHRSVVPRMLLAVAVFAGAAVVGLNRGRLDWASMEAAIGSLGLWGAGAHVLLFALGTVLFLPGAAFALAGGALFGPVWGTTLNLAGATLGATAAFLVARYVAADWARRKAGTRLDRLIGGVEAEGWRFVVLMRLVPLVPFNLLNYALGLTRIPVGAYVLASAIAMAPGALAYTWLGHAGREAAAGSDTAIRYGLMGLALLAAVALVPRLLRRLRGHLTGAAGVRWIEAAELAPRLTGGEGVWLIDVRGPDEYVGPLGHIAGARNVPLSDLSDRLGELATATSTPIVLVCKTDVRSARAAALLDAAGFRDVRVLRGGMARWSAAGLPVARG